jgi:eukaryotic-like serine/threonine-protein kinase
LPQSCAERESLSQWRGSLAAPAVQGYPGVAPSASKLQANRLVLTFDAARLLTPSPACPLLWYPGPMEEESRTGEVLAGRYKVGPLIGKGGHGEVYRATDLQDSREVAVKILAPNLAQDSDYRLRLVREARALEALGGRGTLAVMGIVGANDGTPCLIMELLEGADLSDTIRARREQGQPFSIDEVTTLFMPVVMALDAAHARDIIHRDLKPSNIYIVRGNLSDPRIMDFGLAKMGDLAVVTADRMLAGSPSYVAPEIWAKGARAADGRSDIYSLAVVMYQTLTFEVPIWRDNLAEMLMAVTTPGNIPSLHKARPDLPAEIDDWAEQAFAIDPGQRFQTVVGMWRAFRATIGR